MNRSKGKPDLFENTGKNLLKKQIINKIIADEPIKFVLPGFPCKSSNVEDKVLGKLPDKGEELALNSLDSLCKPIEDVYSNEVYVFIVSDGRVILDTINVSNDDITNYNNSLKAMNISKNLSFTDLDEFIKKDDFGKLRYKLINSYGMSLDELKKEITNSVDTKNLYNYYYLIDSKKLTIIN